MHVPSLIHGSGAVVFGKSLACLCLRRGDDKPCLGSQTETEKAQIPSLDQRRIGYEPFEGAMGYEQFGGVEQDVSNSGKKRRGCYVG